MGSKRSIAFFCGISFALLALSSGAFYVALHKAILQTTGAMHAALMPRGTPPPNSFSLLIEPQAGTVPLQEMIKSASSSIDLVMYEFDDKTLEQLLVARAKEGIQVRVILDNGYFDAGSSVNEEAFDYLRAGGVQVHWSPDYFALTHQKTLVADGSRALIMTFNLSPQYYKSDRDFGVLDSDPNDVAAIETAFNTDWNGNDTVAQAGDDLVWSPNAREQLLALINGANHSLEIYNEEMADPEIIGALAAAAERDVDVEIVMTYSSSWKSGFEALSSAGAHVRTYTASAPLYIHAKVIIADNTQAFVGSQNFSSTSLDQNRELGIILADPKVVAALSKTFAGDWGNATPFASQ